MKICFLSLDSYPVLAKNNWGFAGGAEVEQVDLGLELVKLGYEVSFITYKHGEYNLEKIRGVQVIKTYERVNSSKISQIKKFSSIWSALSKANADIYFHESGATGLLPIFCFIRRRKHVYKIPSDATVIGKNLSGKSSLLAKIINIIEIKKADKVIAQNSFQKQVLINRFNKESCVIRNGINLPSRHIDNKLSKPIVLWVGRITWVKSPLAILEIAKQVPVAHFEIIGGETVGEEALYKAVKAAAAELPNVTFHGFVPYHFVNEYLEKGTLLVNTSVLEAFPITFIQAWANSMPVVSLNADPDGLIKNKQLGFHSGSKKQIISDIEFLLKNEGLRRTMGENGRQYVEREHDVTKVVKEYLKIFEVI